MDHDREVRIMQSGNNKHAAWHDEDLARDAASLTHRGPGTGRAETWRDPEPVTDDDLGLLTGSRWHEATGDAT
jgi:hypothetical protein